MSTAMLAFARALSKSLAVLLWIGAVAVLILLPGCDNRGVRFADGLFDESDHIEALDGDTVLIEGEPYRLAGINAPKPAPDASCWAEALLAHEAREALELALLRKVEIGLDQRDPPNVVRLFVDGRSVSQDLVEQGLAAPTSKSWDWCGPLDLSAPDAPRLNLRRPASEPRSAAASSTEASVSEEQAP